MPIDITIKEATPRTKKRFTAIFRIDHGDKERRKNYIARHEVREKKFYKNPQRAATLSRFILWGPHKTLKKNIDFYKEKFNLS